ncbi:hypothetical protein DM01DRAFT_1334992 [Hesseltinella vesiculosa]|uniref:Uncharacterized protein n=1 Tax=Hesseltinella vesiculosa TaxID=101127 RepID=A0A1X2GK11_9FUNG|nr:hypothetical protein DM01DRAFT_1334992 [Hesseltinella vesiculosa]
MSEKHSAVFIQPSSVATSTVDDVPKDQWVPLEDLNESDLDNDDGDMIIEQRLLVNNKVALQRLTKQMQWTDIPAYETLCYTASTPVSVADVYDDLSREAAFEQQALECVVLARDQCRQHNRPFTPPEDIQGLTLKDRTKSTNPEEQRIKLMKRKRKDIEADDTLTTDFDLDDYQDDTMKSTSILRKQHALVRTSTGEKSIT